MTNISSDQRQHTLELLSIVDRMPALPAAVEELFRLTENVNANIQKVDQVISSDQALVLKLLNVANSAFYGLTQRVATVSQAIVVLGFHGVQSLALGLAMFGFKGNVTCDLPLDREELWRHGLATACVARLLAANLQIKVPEEAFTAGLLHNTGQIVLMEYMPELYADVLKETADNASLCDAERRVFGIDHAELGGLICRRLNLPAVFEQVVSAHHRSDNARRNKDDNVDRIVFAVQTAFNLARIAQIGCDGDCHVNIDFERLSKSYGVSVENLRQILLRVPEDVARMESLFSLSMGKRGSNPDARPVGLLIGKDNERELILLVLLGLGCVPIMWPAAGESGAPAIVIYDEHMELTALQQFADGKSKMLDLRDWRGHAKDSSGLFNVHGFVEWFKSFVSGSGE